MREIASALASWEAAGTPYALATVVRTWASAPRRPGAVMAVSADGEVVGSVSGGCVEADVYELARQVLATGEPVLRTYGVTDADAFAVGLTCGGTLDVLVQSVGQLRQLPVALAAIAADWPVAVAAAVPDGPAVVVEEQDVYGDPASLPAGVIAAAREMLGRGETGVLRPQDGPEVFVHSVPAPPLMLILGATDFAAALARLGRLLGHHVVVCDARPVFATPERFPEADEVVVDWPHRYLERIETDDRTVVCVLTHDPRFDVPVLELALSRPAAYVGAMGSRRTHADRLARLREAGVTEEQLARLSSPIGLDLGAVTPEETAVAIAAELIMLTRGGTPSRLVDGQLAIHR